MRSFKGLLGLGEARDGAGLCTGLDVRPRGQHRIGCGLRVRVEHLDLGLPLGAHELHELLQVDAAVVLEVGAGDHLLHLLRVVGRAQDLAEVLEGDVPGVVRVQPVEGLEEFVLCIEALGLDSGRQELGVPDAPGLVHIHALEHVGDLVGIHAVIGEDGLELLERDGALPGGVDVQKSVPDRRDLPPLRSVRHHHQRRLAQLAVGTVLLEGVDDVL
mmetsp:Transcript_29084/g.65078  ORF Transcript_29084/g.65078 Transcript_29084/m.65078 type:complete len:216 (-) Transcript_29084:1167-1814(-)